MGGDELRQPGAELLQQTLLSRVSDGCSEPFNAGRGARPKISAEADAKLRNPGRIHIRLLPHPRQHRTQHGLPIGPKQLVILDLVCSLAGAVVSDDVIMLFATAIGGRFYGKEQDEA